MIAPPVPTSNSTEPEERVVELPLDTIDIEDDVFLFRVDLGLGPLVRDIEAQGQVIPIVVRRGKGKKNYQIVCGFRRVNALRKIGAATARAIVRDLTDDEAYRLSWVENEARRSYSDLDRVNAIVKAHAAGKTFEELGEVFGLGRKQLSRLESLATLHPVVKEALDKGRISMTHAVVLNEAKRRKKSLKTKGWVEKIEQGLSVHDLRKRLQKRLVPVNQGSFIATEEKVRLRPVSINRAKLSEDERGELDSLLSRLDELEKKSRGFRSRNRKKIRYDGPLFDGEFDGLFGDSCHSADERSIGAGR